MRAESGCVLGEEWEVRYGDVGIDGDVRKA